VRILIEFSRARPLASLGLLACLALAGFAEGLGVSSVLPLVKVAVDGSVSAHPSGVEARLLGVIRGVGLEPTLGVLLSTLTTAFVFKAGLVLLVRRQVGYLVVRVVTEMRLRFLRALLRADWGFFVRRPIGGFVNALITEADRVGAAYSDATWVAFRALQIVIYTSIALATSWRVTLVGLVVAVGLGSGLSPLVRKSRHAGNRQTRILKSLLSRFADFLQGVKPLKSMGRAESVTPLLEKDTMRLQSARLKQVFAKEALSAIQEPLVVGVIGGGFFFLVEVAGMELPSVLLLALLLERAYSSMSKAQQRFQKVVANESAYWALSKATKEAESQADRSGAGPVPELRRGIELEGIELRLGESEVLRGLSLFAPAGEVTALIGPSGAGKTSLVDLVTALLRPDAGAIRIDGHDLETLDLGAWRRSVGYVPQETFLFHDTIARNVTLGDPSFSEADVERVLRDAHAWEFVEALPEGADAMVGERGLALSGGQRQRIAIARALVHRPRLLILDEATTGLDPVSEAAVLEAIEGLRGKATVLAVSHQPALTRAADRVYRIDHGRASLVSSRDASGSKLASAVGPA